MRKVNTNNKERRKMSLREKINQTLKEFEEDTEMGVIETWIDNYTDLILKEIKKEVMKAIPKIINPDKQPNIIKNISTTQVQIVGYNLAIEKIKSNLEKLFEERK